MCAHQISCCYCVSRCRKWRRINTRPRGFLFPSYYLLLQRIALSFLESKGKKILNSFHCKFTQQFWAGISSTNLIWCSCPWSTPTRCSLFSCSLGWPGGIKSGELWLHVLRHHLDTKWDFSQWTTITINVKLLLCHFSATAKDLQIQSSKWLR